jgi:hypothetical protein
MMTDEPTQAVDTALIVDGVIAGLWRNTTAEVAKTQGAPEDGDVREFPAGTKACGFVWDDDGEDFLPPPAPPVPPAPAQVAMHKVQKAALLTPWSGHDHLLAAIETAFTQLPAPSDRLARIEWDKAPNLVRNGATTLAVMAILGMTETQRDDLLNFAASLP